MTQETTPEAMAHLTLEHLKYMRSAIERIEHDIKDLKTGQIGLRSDFHNMRGDFLRLERAMASVEVDIDRINVRLDISDRPAQ